MIQHNCGFASSRNLTRFTELAQIWMLYSHPVTSALRKGPTEPHSLPSQLECMLPGNEAKLQLITSMQGLQEQNVAQLTQGCCTTLLETASQQVTCVISGQVHLYPVRRMAIALQSSPLATHCMACAAHGHSLETCASRECV